MSRYRLVTRTTTAGGTETHVSSVVQTLPEALADLDVEEGIARLSGWHTARHGHGPGQQLVCIRANVLRTIVIRETGPFDDTL